MAGDGTELETRGTLDCSGPCEGRPTINYTALYATAHVVCDFHCTSTGDAKSKQGSAFWAVNGHGELCLVTCRHLVIPDGLHGRSADWVLHRVEARWFFGYRGRDQGFVRFTAEFAADAVKVSGSADIACWKADARLNSTMKMEDSPPVDRSTLANLADKGDLCPNAVGYRDFAKEENFHEDIRVRAGVHHWLPKPERRRSVDPSQAPSGHRRVAGFRSTT